MYTCLDQVDLNILVWIKSTYIYLSRSSRPIYTCLDQVALYMRVWIESTYIYLSGSNRPIYMYAAWTKSQKIKYYILTLTQSPQITLDELLLTGVINRQ